MSNKGGLSLLLHLSLITYYSLLLQFLVFVYGFAT
jgi:hypothetical protein